MSRVTRLWRAYWPLIKRSLDVVLVVFWVAVAAAVTLVVYHWGAPKFAFDWRSATIVLYPSTHQHPTYQRNRTLQWRPWRASADGYLSQPIAVGPLGSVVFACACETRRRWPVGWSFPLPPKPSYVDLPLRRLVQQPSFVALLFSFLFLFCVAATFRQAWCAAKEVFKDCLDDYDAERRKPGPSPAALCWYGVATLTMPAAAFLAVVTNAIADFLAVRRGA